MSPILVIEVRVDEFVSALGRFGFHLSCSHRRRGLDAPAPTQPSVRRALLMILCTVSIVATGVAGPRIVYGADPEDAANNACPIGLERLCAATVLITDDPDDPSRSWWGSGSIVSEDGLILTNAHVAANQAPGVAVLYPEVRYEPPTPKVLYIYGVDGGDQARPLYQAEVVAADGYLDLAVLRIFAHSDGVPVDPDDLNLEPVPIGSSEVLRPLDELTVAGFPSLAESFSVRFSRGELHNRSDDPRVGPNAWLHTDAKISGGNSGGLAVDSSGRLVGIPTQTTADSFEGGTVDYNMRPVELALPLIEAAKSGSAYDQDTYALYPSGDEVATVLGWSARPSDSCVPGNDQVPIGTMYVYAQVEFDGMQPGDPVVVELLELGGSGSSESVRDFVAFEWSDQDASSGCRALPFGYNQSFPYGYYVAFPGGTFGLRVMVGPMAEREITAGPALGALTFTNPDSGATRPSPATPDRDAPRDTRRQVEARLLQRAALVGLDCRGWRDEGRFDPFGFGSTGAIICEGPSRGIAQLALFQFPDTPSLADYWQYRLTQLPANVSHNKNACWNGKPGISAWNQGSIACYVDPLGSRVAKVRWTDQQTNTYGVIDARDGDLSVLFDWWRTNSP